MSITMIGTAATFHAHPMEAQTEIDTVDVLLVGHLPRAVP